MRGFFFRDVRTRLKIARYMGLNIELKWQT